MSGKANECKIMWVCLQLSCLYWGKDIWSQLKNLKETHYKWPHLAKVSNEVKFFWQVKPRSQSQPCSVIISLSWVASMLIQSHCKSNHSIEVDLFAIPSDFLPRGQLHENRCLHGRKEIKERQTARLAGSFHRQGTYKVLSGITKPEGSGGPRTAQS